MTEDQSFVANPSAAAAVGGEGVGLSEEFDVFGIVRVVDG